MAKDFQQGDRIGIWFNKRALGSVDLAFPHALEVEGAGWRIEVAARGDVIVHFREGGAVKKIAVNKGDVIIGNGDDMYISVARVAPGEGAADGAR